MFKVLIIACTILPYPRGEILNTQCFLVNDKWEPSTHGYFTKTKCASRMDLITKTIRENYKLLEIKKYSCQKKTNLSRL